MVVGTPSIFFNPVEDRTTRTLDLTFTLYDNRLGGS